MIQIQTKQVVKRTFSAWFLVVMLCCPLLLFPQAKSKKEKEMESKRNKLKQEINTTNELLRETKNSKKKTMGEVAILNTKISIRQELIATINTEIRQLNTQIGTNQKEVDDLKANLEKLKKEYARMIYYGYRNKDSYNRLMFMFAAGNFNQAYQRLKYIQQYNEYRRKQAEAIVSTQKELNEKIVTLEFTKNEKKQLLTGEEQEKLHLAKEKTEQEGMLAQLQDKEKQLKDELEQKKKDSDALTAAIKKLIAEEIARQQEKARQDAIAKETARKKREEQKKKIKEQKKKQPVSTDVAKDNPKSNKEEVEEPVVVDTETKEAEELSADFASNKGKLPWPVTKGVITDKFGEHEHATIKGLIINNDGVDISTTKGSPCRALFGGEVSLISTMQGMGKVVIIRHGDYLTVYTNLEAVSVKRGDKINSKQTIGALAYNDDENRTVMNLQIWKGQKKLNPQDWLHE
ncbi:MAG: rane-bound metallopeptidase [Bacteroidetes bacterium]|jgi:septal ring factor EnvC (AmiA/AmiB activator)|nr:rane-bound metallopeptidase [Bacteroidota bacterium]